MDFQFSLAGLMNFLLLRPLTKLALLLERLEDPELALLRFASSDGKECASERGAEAKCVDGKCDGRAGGEKRGMMSIGFAFFFKREGTTHISTPTREASSLVRATFSSVPGEASGTSSSSHIVPEIDG